MNMSKFSKLDGQEVVVEGIMDGIKNFVNRNNPEIIDFNALKQDVSKVEREIKALVKTPSFEKLAKGFKADSSNEVFATKSDLHGKFDAKFFKENHFNNGEKIVIFKWIIDFSKCNPGVNYKENINENVVLDFQSLLGNFRTTLNKTIEKITKCKIDYIDDDENEDSGIFNIKIVFYPRDYKA